MDIEVEPRKVEAVAPKLMELREIAILSQYTGTAGLHAHAYIDGAERLSSYLKERIYDIDGVRYVQAQLLIHHYKTSFYLTSFQE